MFTFRYYLLALTFFFLMGCISEGFYWAYLKEKGWQYFVDYLLSYDWWIGKIIRALIVGVLLARHNWNKKEKTYKQSL